MMFILQAKYMIKYCLFSKQRGWNFDVKLTRGIEVKERGLSISSHRRDGVRKGDTKWGKSEKKYFSKEADSMGHRFLNGQLLCLFVFFWINNIHQLLLSLWLSMLCLYLSWCIGLDRKMWFKTKLIRGIPGREGAICGTVPYSWEEKNIYPFVGIC